MNPFAFSFGDDELFETESVSSGIESIARSGQSGYVEEYDDFGSERICDVESTSTGTRITAYSASALNSLNLDLDGTTEIEFASSFNSPQSISSNIQCGGSIVIGDINQEW